MCFNETANWPLLWHGAVLDECSSPTALLEACQAPYNLNTHTHTHAGRKEGSKKEWEGKQSCSITVKLRVLLSSVDLSWCMWIVAWSYRSPTDSYWTAWIASADVYIHTVLRALWSFLCRLSFTELELEDKNHKTKWFSQNEDILKSIKLFTFLDIATKSSPSLVSCLIFSVFGFFLYQRSNIIWFMSF